MTASLCTCITNFKRNVDHKGHSIFYQAQLNLKSHQTHLISAQYDHKFVDNHNILKDKASILTSNGLLHNFHYVQDFFERVCIEHHIAETTFSTIIFSFVHAGAPAVCTNRRLQ